MVKIRSTTTDRKLLQDFVKAANSDAPKEKSEAKQNKSLRLHPDIIRALTKKAKEERKTFAEVHRDVLLTGMQIRGIELEPLD